MRVSTVLTFSLCFWYKSSFLIRYRPLGSRHSPSKLLSNTLSCLGRQNLRHPSNLTMALIHFECEMEGMIAGASKTLPLNHSGCLSERQQAVSPPNEIPPTNIGLQGQTSLTSETNRSASERCVEKSSMQPRSPSDLPNPRQSYPTVVIPRCERYYAKCAEWPMCAHNPCRQMRTALGVGVVLLQRQVWRRQRVQVFFLSKTEREINCYSSYLGWSFKGVFSCDFDSILADQTSCFLVSKERFINSAYFCNLFISKQQLYYPAPSIPLIHLPIGFSPNAQ